MTNFRTAKVVAAAVFWTAAMALGIIGTQDADVRTLFWAVILALLASLLTNHVAVQSLIRQERLNVEHLVEGVLTRAEKKVEAEIRSIR